MSDPSGDVVDRLRPAFAPESIAVVGASRDPQSPGYRYVKDNVDFGFDPVYPVNPGADEVYGREAYDSVLDVPGPVDLAIVALGAEAVPDALRECGEKGVPAVHVMGSGFSEAGTEEGRRLEREVAEVAEEYGLTVIGPNCMGVYNPRAGLTYFSNAPEEPGPVGVVSHSGGFTLDLLSHGKRAGVGFSAVASIGNSVDVTAPDVVEYLLADDDTGIVGAYLEGLDGPEEGRRLADLLASTEKPVVAIKGGKTDRGGEAARSHTGAMAGDYRVWRGVFEGAGVTEVDSIAGMIDALALFSRYREVGGPNAALVGPGGGTTVTTIDACNEAGIEVPRFDDGTVEALRGLDLPAAGNLENPVDVPFSALSLDGGAAFESMIETAAADPGIDAVVAHVNLNHFTYETVDAEGAFRSMVGAVRRAGEGLPVPLLVAFRNAVVVPEVFDLADELRRECYRDGIPVFDSMGRTVRALRRLVEYSRG